MVDLMYGQLFHSYVYNTADVLLLFLFSFCHQTHMNKEIAAQYSTTNANKY